MFLFPLFDYLNIKKQLNLIMIGYECGGGGDGDGKYIYILLYMCHLTVSLRR